MGLFLAVTAFRTDDIDCVANGILEYSQGFELKSQLLENVDEPIKDRHVLIYAPVNGWCVVLWPSYFGSYDTPLAQALSATLDIVVSTIDVYDGDYWSHNFFSSGEQLDSYCSMPTYWSDTDDDTEYILSQSQGRPHSVAQILDIDMTTILGYYTPIVDDKEYCKVDPDDNHELDDIWVFTDYWNKLKIQYPVDIMSFSKVIDLTQQFSKKLPEE